MKQKFIVAEITKNWKEQIWGVPPPVSDLISKKFEKLIDVNYERGYDLQEWKFNQFAHNNTLTETIIAIFKLRDL